MELIKPIVRVGNSAGVILPKEWLHGEAKVTLVKKPENPREDSMEIVKPYLPSLMGLYLVGSYARGEQRKESDIDVLGITTNSNTTIKKGKYDLKLISKEALESSLKENVLPLLPMLVEAVPIMNGDLLTTYKQTPLTKHNLRWHFETTASALEIIHKSIILAKEKNEGLSENIVYSLVLRLREAYLVDRLMNQKKATTKGLLALIKKKAGSLESYELYHAAKRGVESKKTLSLKEAESLTHHLESILKEQRGWIQKNG